MTMKETSLTRFLKDECANYDRHYAICLRTDESCSVLVDGKRCGYFEKCVIGPPGYKYKLPRYDYAKLFAQYAEQTGAETKKVRQRRCGCGELLSYRQRFCDDCKKKHRQKTNRDNQRKYYKKHRG